MQILINLSLSIILILAIFFFYYLSVIFKRGFYFLKLLLGWKQALKESKGLFVFFIIDIAVIVSILVYWIR